MTLVHLPTQTREASSRGLQWPRERSEGVLPRGLLLALARTVDRLAGHRTWRRVTLGALEAGIALLAALGAALLVYGSGHRFLSSELPLAVALLVGAKGLAGFLARGFGTRWRYVGIRDAGVLARSTLLAGVAALAGLHWLDLAHESVRLVVTDSTLYLLLSCGMRLSARRLHEWRCLREWERRPKVVSGNRARSSRMNIVVTGGAGFIGSHVAEHLREVYPDAHLTILDKMTYAAHEENIAHLCRGHGVRVVIGDICDGDLCRRVVRHADLVVHLAAESHVDQSFGNSVAFTTTNTLGTHALLEACRIAKVPRVIHVSTDEVYGEVLGGAVGEDAPFNPTNPYSASKAAAEMITLGYLRSYRQPIIRVRANNIFGIRQYPEKIVPKFCLSLILGRKLTIHGDGSHRRHYLHAQDFAAAIALLIDKGVPGEVYNVGSDEEYPNLEVARMICDVFRKDYRAHLVFVRDRPFNDRRYSISSERVRSLGWRPRRGLVDELPGIAQWYSDNVDRYRQLFFDTQRENALAYA